VRAEDDVSLEPSILDAEGETVAGALHALGYGADRMSMAPFCAGSALSGLAGAVFAPLVGLVPASGGAYIAKAVIVVIAGGTSLITGLISSSSIFGIIHQAFTFSVSPVVGEVALLVAAVILLRLLPQGITGRRP